MAELEEKLNAILGNQEAMGQIMALAHSLSAGSKKDPEQQGDPEEETDKPEPPQSTQPESDISSLLGQIDPGMLQMGMRLLQEYQGNDDRNAALLNALRPFVREERRAKLDRALQIARVTRLIRVALETIGGKGEEGDV